LVENPEEKSPLGSPKSRWENNNKIYLKEVGKVCPGFIWFISRTRGMR
jgi:hypothetical protein